MKIIFQKGILEIQLLCADAMNNTLIRVSVDYIRTPFQVCDRSQCHRPEVQQPDMLMFAAEENIYPAIEVIVLHMCSYDTEKVIKPHVNIRKPLKKIICIE